MNRQCSFDLSDYDHQECYSNNWLDNLNWTITPCAGYTEDYTPANYATFKNELANIQNILGAEIK